MIVKRASLTPLEFEDLRIFDYTAGKDLSSSLAVIEVPPQVRHAEAWSKRSDKYYFVTGGEIRFVLDGAPTILYAGDVCFVRRGQRFSYSNDSAGPATLVLFHTPPFDIAEEVFV